MKRWAVAALIGVSAVVAGVLVQRAGWIESRVAGPFVGAVAALLWLQVTRR